MSEEKNIHYPKTALIKSSEQYPFKSRICGLFPLERLILLLESRGIEKLYLDLSEEEQSFYEKHVVKRIKRAKNITIITGEKPQDAAEYISLPSNQFSHPAAFDAFDTSFSKEGKVYRPQKTEVQFPLLTRADSALAQKAVEEHLIKTTTGFFSREINKKISIPISSFIGRFRPSPNLLTLINFVFGIISAWLILQESWLTAAAGAALFNIVSILDGVDGEVARFTFRTSKIGGWLDTICDHIALALVISAIGHLYFRHFSLEVSIFFIVLSIIGFIWMILENLAFLKKAGISQSLKSYGPEFLDRLPESDGLVRFTRAMQYLVKKELYSMIIMAFGLVNMLPWVLPVFAVVSFGGSILTKVVNSKYLEWFLNENY